MTGTFIIFLFFHILCCVITFIGIATQILDVHRYMFFVVLLVPFWGFAIVLILHFQIAFKADDSKEIEMQKMRIDSELYKSVTVDKSKTASTTVPIEEALIVNSAKERREIIMDVLNDNPKEYVEFLRKAGNNEDTEVVHYAVTAMVEISKENDFTLQQFESKYRENPDDYDLLCRYCDFLWSCLEQNLMQGQVEVMNRKLFADLMVKKLAITESVEDYLRFAENCIKLKNFTGAGDALRKAEIIEPENEEILLMKIKYYALLERGDDIKSMLEKVENDRIFLSAKAKEAIAFWKV